MTILYNDNNTIYIVFTAHAWFKSERLQLNCQYVQINISKLMKVKIVCYVNKCHNFKSIQYSNRGGNDVANVKLGDSRFVFYD